MKLCSRPRDAAPDPLRLGRAGALCALLAGLCGCLSHDVSTEPIEIKPIHITMDINLKVQRELDEFFSFEDEVDPDRASEANAPRDAATDDAFASERTDR